MPFIDSSSDLWKEFTGSVLHDIYHLAGYAQIDAKLLGGKAIGYIGHAAQTGAGRAPHPGPLLASTRLSTGKEREVVRFTERVCCLIPLIERRINANYYDLVSPYGFPGVLVDGAVADAEIGAMLEAFNEEATAAGYVSTFIRLNPLMNNWCFSQDRCFTQFTPGETLSVDPLSLDSRSYYNNNVRRNLSRLSKMGCRAVINDWSQYDYFQHAYRQTMIRKNTLSYYHFPDWYFTELREMGGDHLILISVIGEQYMAGALFTNYDGVMQYHLSGTADDAVWLSPSKLIIESASQYALENHIHTLHLGGGAGGVTTDGLYRFKRCFATQSHSFSCLKFIHRPDVYNNLCNGRQGEFFPEYRSK